MYDRAIHGAQALNTCDVRLELHNMKGRQVGDIILSNDSHLARAVRRHVKRRGPLARRSNLWMFGVEPHKLLKQSEMEVSFILAVRLAHIVCGWG